MRRYAHNHKALPVNHIRPVLLLFWLLVQVCCTPPLQAYIQEIRQISEAERVLMSADQKTLIVFDVDNVISAPSDTAGRPSARHVRRALFREYEQKHGPSYVVNLHALYMEKGTSGLVEARTGEVIRTLQKSGLPVIALTAKGTDPFGSIQDPIRWRLDKLARHGVVFSWPGTNARILWGKGAGYEQGVVFSGSRSKGEALAYFLDSIAHWQPARIIFLDDNAAYLKSVEDLCLSRGISFQGFHYLAKIFDEDPPANPSVVRLQFDTLHKTGRWLSDTEAGKILLSR